MRSVVSVVVATAFAGVSLGATISTGETRRIEDAVQVLNDMHSEPDRDIPQDTWNRAACVAVIPSLKKAAFIVGGEFGKGLMSCRNEGGWTAPVFMELGKGSWGFQIGAQEVDLVLLVMNRAGVNKLLRDKVSLGADASVAAGPVGRNAAASTDAQFKAEILSYSRAQGLFAGVDISGGVLRPDKDDNADLYGAAATPESVLAGTIKAPAVTEPFVNALRRSSVAATTGIR